MCAVLCAVWCCLQVTLRLLEHLYYKTTAVYDAMRKLCIMQQQQIAAGEDEGEEGTKEEDEKVTVKVCAVWHTHTHIHAHTYTHISCTYPVQTCTAIERVRTWVGEAWG